MKFFKKLICLFKGHDWPFDKMKRDAAGTDVVQMKSNLDNLLAGTIQCRRCEITWNKRSH